MALEAQAPGRVRMVLGNHEALNLVGALDYVTREEFAAYAADETAKEREAGFRAWADLPSNRNIPGDERRRLFDEQFPPGWFAHRRAFSPSGRYGSWLLKRNALERIDRSLIVHGGITLDDARLGIDVLNRRIVGELKEYFRLRRKLNDDGWTSPVTGLKQSCRQTADRLSSLDEQEHDRQLEPVSTAEAYLDLCRQAAFVDPLSPLWYRGLAQAEGAATDAEVNEIVRLLDVDRIVISHTPRKSGRIQSAYDGQVYLIDTGAGPAYGGHVSALEISADGRVRAIYPDGQELLAEAAESDATVERFLREAEIVERRQIGSGITRPWKCTLELDGRQRKAAFKTLHQIEPGIKKLPGGFVEMGFTDSYRFEPAAYLLDRLLGMHMVPVAVLRHDGGKEGALVDWVEDAVGGVELRDRKLQPPDARAWALQRGTMAVFDALICNTDRNLGNELVTLDDWKLHLIDHSRCFCKVGELPPGFVARPIRLPRPLLSRLQALDEQVLDKLLAAYLNRTQLRSLLARRDLILEKIAHDRETYTDSYVFAEVHFTDAAAGSRE
jgi:hypothetical protein